MDLSLTRQEALLAVQELRDTAARLNTENSAVLARFKDRPLTTSFQHEHDERAKKAASFGKAADFLMQTFINVGAEATN